MLPQNAKTYTTRLIYSTQLDALPCQISFYNQFISSFYTTLNYNTNWHTKWLLKP
jgi:hypothetical protein